MARESKRTRNEKRFGESQTFADWLMENPIGVREGLTFTADEMRPSIAESGVLNIDNVCEFALGHPEKEWDFRTDFPCCIPFAGQLFVEFTCGPVVNGFLLWEADRSESTKTFMAVYLSRDSRSRATWSTASAMALCSFKTHADSGDLSAFLVDMEDTVTEQHIRGMLGVMLLAFSFANCKNTTIEPHDPDAKVNRVRRKAGLKPFVRYHTINIEPMRKVLKTEGGIEANGLKKALHICRGHFRRYTEEKPLFGHTSGLVWTPAHVRGSVKEGVVVSDYKVSP